MKKFMKITGGMRHFASLRHRNREKPLLILREMALQNKRRNKSI